MDIMASQSLFILRKHNISLFEDLYHHRLDPRVVNCANTILILRHEEAAAIEDLRPISPLNGSLVIIVLTIT